MPKGIDLLCAYEENWKKRQKCCLVRRGNSIMEESAER